MKPINQQTIVEVMGFLRGVDKKTWVTVLSSAVGGLLFIVFIVFPSWIERPMLRKNIQSMETQIRQVQTLSQKRGDWEKNQKEFGSLIEKTQARVFTADDMGVFLGQVSKMASESRTEVQTSNPLNEKAVFAEPYNLKYQPSGYEFTVEGGYHDLGNLVSRLESHEKLLRIQSMKIVPSEKTPGRNIAELKLWAILKAPPPPPKPVKTAKAGSAKAKVKSAKK